jgi:DNA-binding PadR family transcriptional regulator
MTTRQEWLLMALALRDGQPLTPAQIQKAMFLMSAEAPELVGQAFYNFIPYNYGPFDSNVYSDLDVMTQKGLVTASTVSGRSWKVYAITPAGLDQASKAGETADPKGLEFLKRVVDWVASMSFPELVRAIYAKYPAYKANSVFTG